MSTNPEKAKALEILKRPLPSQENRTRWSLRLTPATSEVTSAEWLPKARVKILEVGSLHLRLRSSQERQRILKADEEFWNGLRFSIQRLSFPVTLDLDTHLGALSRQADADLDPDRAQVLRVKVDHLRSMIRDRHLIEWRNLVVIPLDDEADTERATHVRSSLERIGLTVRTLTEAEADTIWQEIAPPNVVFDFSHMDHFRIGPTLCRVLAVRDYPRKVSLSQFLDTYRLDRRVTVVQHFHPAESASLQREVSNSIGEMTGRLAGPLSEHVRTVEEAKLQDAQKLLRQLSGDNQNVLDFSMYLLLRASTLEDLNEVTKRTVNRLAGKGMWARPVQMWQQQDAFRCCLPATINPLRELTQRNLWRPVLFGIEVADMLAPKETSRRATYCSKYFVLFHENRARELFSRCRMDV